MKGYVTSDNDSAVICQSTGASSLAPFLLKHEFLKLKFMKVCLKNVQFIGVCGL